MVDLSKAKIGDTVKFRCGGQAVIEKITDKPDRASRFAIYAVGYDNCAVYKQDGVISLLDESSPLDIVEVIPPAQELKWGMAFGYYGSNNTYIFIGYNPGSKYEGIFQTLHSNGELETFVLDGLVRQPEYDCALV